MEQVLSSIDKYIGAPYKLNSYDGKSFDCFSLVWYIYKDNGIILDKHFVRNSLRTIAKEISIREQQWVPINFTERKFLDLVLFRTSKHLLTHVGIIITPEFFIHTTEDTNAVLSRFTKSVYSALMAKVYRWHTQLT